MINKSKMFVLVGLVMMMTIVAACGNSGSTTEGNAASSSASSGETPSAEVERYENGLPKNEKVSLKVGFFVGGYGQEWFDHAVETFTAKYPNVSFDVTASPDMKTILSTKISAGNDDEMFDLFNTPPSGGIVPLAEAGKLEPMDDLWDRTLPDAPDKTVKELMIPGMYEASAFINGKTYEFATASSFGGLFFNKKLFEEHGWNQNPKTWDEFKQLLADIKADGVAPITFPGIYPDYYERAFGPTKMFELAAMNGSSDEFIENYKNFVLPQYTSPETMEHWNRLYELGQLGYFAEGLPALTHTQSQMQVIQGQAAMVATGSHVENEMKEATPEDFEWGFMVVPFRESTGQELWVASGTTHLNYIWAAKPELNKQWAKEFILWVLTLENQQFKAEHGGAMPMRKDLIDNPERMVHLISSVQSILKYVSENDARPFKPSRSISISDPNYAQATKLMNDAIVKVSLGLQDPKPVLEQAEELLTKALEAEQ